MKTLTPRDKRDIGEFKRVTGSDLIGLNRYLSGEWEWHHLWDYNFDNLKASHEKCSCRLEGLKASGRRKGHPISINDLQRLGFEFALIRGGESWYTDAYYQCSCGQKWKEVFIEAMQYNSNHAYPITDDEFNQTVLNSLS